MSVQTSKRPARLATDPGEPPARGEDHAWRRRTIERDGVDVEVPDEVCAAVALQDDPQCWPLLKLLHAVPELLDIARQIPTLAGLLALKPPNPGPPDSSEGPPRIPPRVSRVPAARSAGPTHCEAPDGRTAHAPGQGGRGDAEAQPDLGPSEAADRRVSP